MQTRHLIFLIIGIVVASCTYAAPSIVWVKNSTGGFSYVNVNDVTVDSDNNIIACGPDFGPGGSFSSFKYYPNGSEMFSTHPGGTFAVASHGVAVDSYDNFVVVGEDSSRRRIIKYNRTGSEIFDKKSSSSGEYGYAVAIDSGNNIIVTGETGSSDYDTRTIKYDENGTELWNKVVDVGGWGGSDNDKGWRIAVDDSNNIYVLTVDHAWEYLGAVIKYHPNGTALWSKGLDWLFFDNLTQIAKRHIYQNGDIAVDLDGNLVIVSGLYYELYDENMTFIGSSNNSDFYIIKMNSSDGQWIWNATYDAGDDELALGVNINSKNDIIVTGRTNATGNYDYLTVKYDENGTYEWNTTYGSTLWGDYNDSSRAVIVDEHDYIIVSGDPATIKYTEYSCSDSLKNQDETDVDCGGSVCNKCDAGKVCLNNSDCANDKCISGVCETKYPNIRDNDIVREINYSVDNDTYAVQFLLFYPPEADIDLHVYYGEHHIGFNKMVGIADVEFPAIYSGKYANPEIIYIPDATNKTYKVVAELVKADSNSSNYINVYALKTPFRPGVLAAMPANINKTAGQDNDMEISVVVSEAGCQKPLTDVTIEISDLIYNDKTLDLITSSSLFVSVLPACTSVGADFGFATTEDVFPGEYTGTITVKSAETSAQTIPVSITVQGVGVEYEFRTATLDYDASGYVFIASTIEVNGAKKNADDPPHYKASFDVSADKKIETCYSAEGYKPDCDNVYFDKRLTTCSTGSDCNLGVNSAGYKTSCDWNNNWNSFECSVSKSDFESDFVYFPDEGIVQRVNYLEKK